MLHTIDLRKKDYWENPVYELAQLRFRGENEEIHKLEKYLAQVGKPKRLDDVAYQLTMIDAEHLELIIDCTSPIFACRPEYDTGILIEIIEQFPQLKVTGLAENFGNSSVEAFYSEIGATFITDVVQFSGFDPQAEDGEGRWATNLPDMMEDYNCTFEDTRTSCRVKVSYHFPWKEEWCDGCRFAKDRYLFRRTEKKEKTKESNTGDDLVLEKYLEDGGNAIIPDGVTSIGDRAFAFCRNLSSVTIPQSVISIGRGAFDCCKNLTSIEIPEGVTVVESRAFEGCTGLREVKISQSVISIGCHAFDCCENLTRIEIPEGVTVVESGIFEGCTSLREVKIPQSVITIGYDAFKNCENLTSIEIPEGVTVVKSGAFEGCISLRDITIPPSVISIDFSAFSGCSSLKRVLISEGVTSVGACAFRGCSGLTEVVIPSSVVSIGVRAFEECSSLKHVVILDGVTTIDKWVFFNCHDLVSVTIPETVTSIGDGAFSGCPGLTDSSGLVVIRDTLFGYYGKEATVTIPQNVRAIGYETFFKCDSLTEIVIPANVATICEKAFAECVNLKKVAFLGIPNETDSMAFWGSDQAQLILPHEKIKAGIAIPDVFPRRNNLFAEKDIPYLMLYQTGSDWKKWREARKPANTTSDLENMCAILEQQNPVDYSTGKRVAEYISDNYKQLEPALIERAMAFYPPETSTPIDKLAENRLLMRHIGKEITEITPAQAASDCLIEKIVPHEIVRRKVRKGILWKDSKKEKCQKEIVAAMISAYAWEWERCVGKIKDDSRRTSVLQDGSSIKIQTEADQLAALLNPTELDELLTQLISDKDYRPFILAWARYAKSETIQKIAGEYKRLKRGGAKERYFAKNLEQALLLSDTIAAVQFYDALGTLERYAAYRAMTASELRKG